MKFRESNLAVPVVAYLANQGYDCHVLELPFYEYRIDIYGLASRNGHTVAVELKLSRWKRALEQAALYQLCADRSFIAMPLASALRVPEVQLNFFGIGLIGVDVDGNCKQIIAAKSHSEVRMHYKKLQTEYVRSYAKKARASKDIS